MIWLELSVAVDRDRADRAAELLEAHGAVAVTLAGADDEDLLEPLPGEQPLWQRVLMRALIEADADLKLLRDALAPAGARLVDVDFLGEADWQERWRAHAARGRFGRLWLMPRDETLPDEAAVPEAVVLRLDPGLAFGSGSHPTTRLCLAGLADLPLTGARVLDYGCGSGILAVAACLLGAGHVVAVDHDPQALVATRDNAEVNGVAAQRLEVMSPERFQQCFGGDAAGGFDVVVANILANPLVELASRLIAQLKDGGVLMLSGLLAEQEGMIRSAYAGLDFGAARREGDWIRLDGRRASASSAL